MNTIDKLDELPKEYSWMEDWCFVYFEDRFCVVKYWSESRKKPLYSIFNEGESLEWSKIWFVKTLIWTQPYNASYFADSESCIEIIKTKLKKERELATIVKPDNFRDECVER